jgi:hypothetical protein
VKTKSTTLLYDRLVVDTRIDSKIKGQLREAMVIDATNVSDYYFQGTDQETWNLGTDFPNVAPPFETFYLEFRAPHEMVSRDLGITPWPKELPIRWGVLCLSGEMSGLFPDLDTDEGRIRYAKANAMQIEGLQKTLGPQLVQKANESWAMHDVDRSRDLMQQVPASLKGNLGLYYLALTMRVLLNNEQWEEAKELLLSGNTASVYRWRMACVLFAQFPAGNMQQQWGPFWGWEMNILPDGRLHRKQNGDVDILYSAIGIVKENVERQMSEDHDAGVKFFRDVSDTFGKFLHTALLAISFMHCKNVVLSQQVPPRIEPTQKQKRWKMLPPQPVTYHVLDIEPMKQVLRTEGQSEKTGIQRSLHICRGHFAHYDEEHKLFGKYAGTFWKPQHVRGTSKVGIAVKDYRIKSVNP